MSDGNGMSGRRAFFRDVNKRKRAVNTARKAWAPERVVCPVCGADVATAAAATGPLSGARHTVIARHRGPAGIRCEGSRRLLAPLAPTDPPRVRRRPAGEGGAA